jgi:hypothetical protein
MNKTYTFELRNTPSERSWTLELLLIPGVAIVRLEDQQGLEYMPPSWEREGSKLTWKADEAPPELKVVLSFSAEGQPAPTPPSKGSGKWGKRTVQVIIPVVTAATAVFSAWQHWELKSLESQVAAKSAELTSTQHTLTTCQGDLDAKRQRDITADLIDQIKLGEAP